MNRRRALLSASAAALAVAIACPAGVHAAACGTAACGSATGVTYNGTSLTFAGASTNGTVRSELWYLVAPPSGAHNVVVTAPNANAVTATSMSFTGVNQATPLGSPVSAIGTSTTPSVSTTSAVGEPLFDVVGAVGTTAPVTTGATQTVRQTNTTATGLDHVVVGSSTAPGAGATSISMSWTIPSADWAQIAVPVKASPALTEVAVSDLTATLQANDVLVQWSDGYEPSSLGFYVYRSDGTAGRVQLNGSIIPGNALGTGASSFSWKDASPGWDGAVSYWVEDVGLDGSTVWYGPVTPRSASAPGGAGGAPATSLGGAPGGGWMGVGGQAPAESPAGGGCTIAARDPRGTLLQLVLALGLVAGVRRRKRLGALIVLYAVTVAASGLFSPRTAAGAGGVSIDASATGTGASGLTFSHTMGAGANGLLVVGVVVPITCDNTATDGGNCGACGATCAQDVGASLSTGLLGLWRFDEGSGTTSVDSSGNGNTATLFNSPSWTTGYAGDAVEGNGTNSYVQANIGAWFGANNTLSVSAWTYVNANSNGPVVGIAGSSGGWNMPFLSVHGSTVYGWLWGVPGTNSTTSPLAATVSLDAWHFLAVTYDPNGGGAGVGQEIFYVDGAFSGAATGTYAPSGTTDNFGTVIGGAKPTAVTNSYLLGKVDEVRAYNRTLSAADVTALYGARLACSSSTCAACSAGETACSGSCVTTATDVNNCGSCGHACNTAGGETCVAGACTCTTGTDCFGVCTTTSTDPNNCGGCGTACGMPTNAALDSGLIGLWHLDEGSGTTSADSSGTGNTATLSGATWTKTGYSGDAVAGDGSSSYVSANLGTYFGTNSALTASAWVYATATTNGPVFGVTSIPAGGGWNMPFLSIAGPTAYGWLWGVPGTDPNSSPLAATVSLNAWHFLAITYSPSGGSGTEKFYVDGTLAGTASGAYQPSNLVDSWSTTIPNAKPTAVTNSFLNGQVDEVRAYGRALSAAEISILYNARQTCTSSTCGGCSGGESLCGGDCTDKTIDASNCGACGTTCNISGGESCIASSCGCSSGTDCGTVCIDTTSDQNNCGGCGVPCGAVTCTSCGSGMSGLWHLDEGSGATSADSSGNGNTATLNSSPTWVTGESGQGLTFNGTSYMTATLGSWWGNNNTLSASAWVYATSTTNGPIFGVTQTLPGTNWDMPFLSIAGSTVFGWLWQVNGNTPLSATVTLNAWHMLTITYDPNGGGAGVGKEIFYVDGVASSSGTGTYAPSGTTDYLTTQIQGAKPSAVTNSILKGTIDELRAYTRVLSPGEIVLLYNARQVCTASACTGCPSGTTSCGAGVCQNTACGACGSPCTGTQQCVSGTCM
jgi:hypothetical protein